MTTVAKVTLGERTLEYRFAGAGLSGPHELVLLHEGLGSVSLWRDFPDRLAAATRCRTLLYSRHGHGRSSPLTAPRAIDFMHEEARTWLPQLLARLGVERPVLVGHSDGASIALIRAADNPQATAGVVALAPHIMVEDITVASIERIGMTYESTDLRRRLARHHDDVDGAFVGWQRLWLDPAFRSWSIEALLPSIRCPVLAIQGVDDEYGSLEQVDGIRRRLPAAQVLVLSACGHAPQVAQPTAVIEAIRAFVASLDQAAPAPDELHR